MVWFCHDNSLIGFNFLSKVPSLLRKYIFEQKQTNLATKCQVRRRYWRKTIFRLFLLKNTKLKRNYLKQSRGFSDKNVSRQWLVLKLMKWNFLDAKSEINRQHVFLFSVEACGWSSSLAHCIVTLEEKLYSTLSPGESVAVLLAVPHATKPG